MPTAIKQTNNTSATFALLLKQRQTARFNQSSHSNTTPSVIHAARVPVSKITNTSNATATSQSTRPRSQNSKKGDKLASVCPKVNFLLPNKPCKRSAYNWRASICGQSSLHAASIGLVPVSPCMAASTVQKAATAAMPAYTTLRPAASRIASAASHSAGR